MAEPFGVVRLGKDSVDAIKEIASYSELKRHPHCSCLFASAGGT